MLDTEKIVLSGSPIEIAEYADYKLATFLISVLDEYDLMGRMIPKESGELYHSTMVGFPILAKMVCNEAGDPVDFAGHEMYIVMDENGNSQVRFNTHPIGSVVESWIEERAVAGYVGNKSCIMIKAKLWSTRYPEYFAVLDKLWANNNVKSSWELTVQEAVQTAKGRILKAFSFIGNTLLGSNVIGAVPGAGVYEYAQLDSEVELAAALSRDVCAEDAQRKEDNALENENIVHETVTNQTNPDEPAVAETTENIVTEQAAESSVVDQEPTVTDESPVDAGTETAENTDGAAHGASVEEAMLTEYDLYHRVSAAYQTKYGKWCWVAFWFPASNEAWLAVDGRGSELDYVRVTYTVVDDNVAIDSAEDVKLTVAVSEINHALEVRDDAIEKANVRINDLSAQIAALQPYKDAADKAEQDRIEAETAEKRKMFREKMIASKLFDEQEIETSEALRSMIESLDETGLKSEIAERFMAKLDAAPAETEVAQVTAKTEETRVHVAEAEAGSKEFMRIFLGKNN